MAHDYTPLDAAPAAVPMFCNVRYVDKREMAPCAVTKVIMVPDPCQPKDACCQKCVAIEICVPPCGCEEIKCNRAGNRIRYCYGDYAVDVRIRKGLIVVDYQD